MDLKREEEWNKFLDRFDQAQAEKDTKRAEEMKKKRDKEEEELEKKADAQAGYKKWL